MNRNSSIETRLGSVAYTLLGVRHSTLHYFFRDFKIDYLSQCENITDNDAAFVLKN
ncbi:MAG: hypothetical protein KBT58_11615 [Bizionia sp.]|nr:hypothetical protein [Bizionia sp.]